MKGLVLRNAAKITVVCIIGSSTIFGGSIATISSKADAIVVGSISTRIESATEISFDIAVERILKGSAIPPTIHVSHTRVAASPTRTGVQPTTVSHTLRGVWSLTRSSSSDWDVIPVTGPAGTMPSLYWPAAPISPAIYQYRPDASIADVLTLEIGAAVQSYGRRPELFLDAVNSLTTPAVQTVLSDFLNSPSAPFRCIGVAGMLQRADPNAIAKLAQIWPGISGDKSRSYALSALRDFFRPSQPQSVQQLGALVTASSTSAEIRNASVAALAAIHTKESLPALATLLSSADPEEQMKGVYGISSYVNGCPAQTRDNVKSMAYLYCTNTTPYQTNETATHFAFRRGPATEESALVAYWLQWWRSHPELH